MERNFGGLVSFASAGLQALDDESRPDALDLSHRSAGTEAFTEPYETIKLASADAGIVDQVKVKLGDTVQQGELLFELDMSVLEASRRLAQAKAQSTARLKAAEAEYESKTKRYQQLIDLLKENAGSPEEVERAKTQSEIARQGVEAILEETEQFVLETKRIESQIERRRARSPINGVVIEIRKKPGEYVSSNDPQLATIVQLNLLRVVFHLPTESAVRIHRGDAVRVLLTETNQMADARVEYVAPTTSADSGRVRLEVRIDNQQRQYRSGVRCRFMETTTQEALLSKKPELR